MLPPTRERNEQEGGLANGPPPPGNWSGLSCLGRSLVRKRETMFSKRNISPKLTRAVDVYFLILKIPVFMRNIYAFLHF